MRFLMTTAVLALGLGLTGAAQAQNNDDEPSCKAGIAFIEAEQAKNPAPALAETLRRALVSAKREYGEAEWDECMDAVRRARSAVAAG